MRSLFQFAGRLYHGARLAVQLHGGLAAALSAVVRVIREEGATGLRSRLSRSNAAEYPEWVRRYDTIDSAKREELRNGVAQLTRRPVISVVVPVYNTPEEHLRQMIESVIAQIYPDWELCVADDASTASHVAPVLQEYARRDSRIKFVRRSVNGHICAASNDALALASGTFIALLDHDDVLPEHALYMVAVYLNRFPTARMLYSDEDKLAPDGTRIQPYFKSDWNSVLMLGQNMFSHLGVFETKLVREVGGFRPGFEGSQDYDLALRCWDAAGDDAIVHIPHVLYHWRVSAISTASGVAAKPYAKEASLRAVREHLKRRGQSACVELLSADSTMTKVCYAVSEPPPLVSIIVPTRDHAELLSKCIDSVLERTDYPNYEILIVDNGSSERSALDLLASYAKRSNVSILRVDAPFNFSALNNTAVTKARGTILCLLNNDIEVISPNWLRVLCGYAAVQDIGAVGAALWYPDDRLQHGGVLLGVGDVAGHMHHRIRRGDVGYFGRAALAQEVSAVTAACLVVRKELYEKVGGLDAEHLQVAFNDVDFCLKLRAAGYRTVYVPYVDLYHHESASRGSDLTEAQAARFSREVAWVRRRWSAQIENDPFYNPNLALAGPTHYSLAFPPRVGQFS